jgi:putative membrane protein
MSKSNHKHKKKGGIIARTLINAAAICITAYLLNAIKLDGFKISGFEAALIASLILGIVNAFIRPIILICTLPINILTLGLFTFVINGVLLKVVAGVITGFTVGSYTTAIIASIVISIVSSIISSIVL